MKDINISDGIFIPSPGLCPRGSDLRVPWGVGESKNVFPKIQPDLACELLTSMAHTTAQFLGPHPLGPWGGAKRSNIIKPQSQSQFQRFLNQTLCVFSQMKDIKKYQTGFSFYRFGHAPGVGLRGIVGVGGQKTFPPNSSRFGV